jgi:hypothetical protein
VFYCALLGAQRGHGGADYEQILVGDEMILQLHGPEPDSNHGPLADIASELGNGVVVWFETDDFDAFLDRVAEHQIELEREPFENVYARQMEGWLRDPDGSRVVIAGPSAWPRTALAE